MRTYVEYLSSLTVKALREIASRMEIKGRSGLGKVELVGAIGTVVNMEHDDALVQDIEFDELASAPKGVEINGVTFGSGWNCCKENPAKVMTFDDGGKWAVCESCSHTVSPKRISELPAEDIKAYKGEPEPTFPILDENGIEIMTLTGDSARVMEYHIKNVKRFNPGMVRDRDGMVILTAKQRRRVQKKDRSFARKIGFLTPKVAA
jgi:hypothetical protein